MAAARQAESSRVWKVGTRRGMVYAEGRDLTEKILSISHPPKAGEVQLAEGKQLRPTAERMLPGTMAVYCDKKGKPFAWQIVFDLRDWDSVSAMVGVEAA